MSTILYGSEELGNVAAVAYYRQDEKMIIDALVKISEVNTAAFNARYGENEKPITRDEIKRWTPHTINLKQAAGTARMFHYNCCDSGVKPNKEQLAALLMISNEVLGAVNRRYFDSI
jgi:hypothetical protein